MALRLVASRTLTRATGRDRTLHAAVEACMAALHEHRDAFSAIARSGSLRHSYERFRCDLMMAGFRVSGLEPRDRARAHRRLGLDAERRGDLESARLHYDLALRSWPRVGVRKRLSKLQFQLLQATRP